MQLITKVKIENKHLFTVKYRLKNNFIYVSEIFNERNIKNEGNVYGNFLANLDFFKNNIVELIGLMEKVFKKKPFGLQDLSYEFIENKNLWLEVIGGDYNSSKFLYVEFLAVISGYMSILTNKYIYVYKDLPIEVYIEFQNEVQRLLSENNVSIIESRFGNSEEEELFINELPKIRLKKLEGIIDISR